MAFLFRRTVLCLTIIFWQSFLWGELFFSYITSTFYLIILQWACALSSRYDKQIETLNEFCILLALYCMNTFNEFVGDP